MKKKYMVIAMSLETGEILTEEIPVGIARAGFGKIVPAVLEMENGEIIWRGYYVQTEVDREEAYQDFSGYLHSLYAIGSLV